MLKKVSLIFIAVLSVLLCTFSPVYADKDYRIIIDDEADLLSDSEEKMLQAKMSDIVPYGNVAFKSVYQYDDTSVYAKQLYREYFGKDSGFLFVIDMGRRNIWIFSDGAIYKVINKPYANTITDNVYRYASKGEYYNCAYYVYDQANTLLEGGKISQPMKHISNVLIALVLALLINFFILIIQRSDSKVPVETALAAMTSAVGVRIFSKVMTKSKRSKHVEYSGSSGGGGYSGGGGGGGGGGGSSGGGGGHSF